jgi:hypothetical protein
VLAFLVACGHPSTATDDAATLEAGPGADGAIDGALIDAAADAGPQGMLAQQAYLKASNTGALDSFGSSIAISADGTTLAVGANNEASAATGVGGDQTSNSAPSSGAVYIFVRSGATWAQQAYVKASNTDTNDLFGTAIALSADGSTLAVGSPLESSGATGIDGNQTDNAAHLAGAVYVFARSGTAWHQQAYVKASNAAADAEFGDTLALSGDGTTLAVSAFGDASAATGIDGNQADRSANDAGAVYVFTRSGATWSQQAYVKASNANAFDAFGSSVAIDGHGATMIVGALGEHSAATGVGGNQADNSELNAGAAYVFTRSGGTWSQQAYLKASNTGAGDEFGLHVAISSDGATAAVAAPIEQSAATGIDGNQADNTATRAGAVYVFSRSGVTWAQEAYIKASNTDAEDQFGADLALTSDGSTLAICASGEGSSARGLDGAVYLFGRTGATWSQRTYLKASTRTPRITSARPRCRATARRSPSAPSSTTARPPGSAATKPTTGRGIVVRSTC